MKRVKPEPQEQEEVTVNEQVAEAVEPGVEPEEIVAPAETAKVIMSPEAIESRYQAFLEKIKQGGK